MKMVGYAVTFVGGVVLGIVIDKMIIDMKKNKNADPEKILEECFGDPMHSNKFSLIEARDWIKSREDKIKNGANAVILKINSETLKAYGKDLNISKDVGNYILLAVVDKQSNEFIESALVKYDSLEEKLEQALSKGNGILVVGE